MSIHDILNPTKTQLRNTVRKIQTLYKALTVQKITDDEAVNDNITDFGWSGLLDQSEKILDGMTYAEFAERNPDVDYQMQIMPGSRYIKKFGDKFAGKNEIYPRAADQNTPPFTHEELLDLAITTLSAIEN